MKARMILVLAVMTLLVLGTASLVSFAAQPGVKSGAKLPSLPVAPSATSAAGSGGGDVLDPDLGEPEAVGLDPDLPLIAQGKVKKSDYMRLRAENIQALRGLPYAKAGQVRAEALRAMERQRAALKAACAESVMSSWTFVGPAPLPNGQTQTISTPVSGRVSCIAVNPTNPNIAYVGAAQGGVYRTLDGGTTWTALMDTAQTLAIGAVAIAPSNPNIVYVGTGESAFSADSFFGVGVYRIDNAETTADLSGPFNPLVTTGIAGTTAFTGRAISKILVHPTDPATIFVATTSGIHGLGATSYSTTVPPLALRGLYRSTDATSLNPSFSKITVTGEGSLGFDTSGNHDITDMVFEPGNPNNLIAWVFGPSWVSTGGGGGAYRSTNALAASPTFTQTRTATFPNSRGEFAINKVGSVVTVVAATGEGAGGSGILRISTDGGQTWSPSITNFGTPGGIGFCYGQCWYDIAVDVDPTSTGSNLVIYLGGAANGNYNRMMVKSTNAGASWTDISTGLHADTHALAVSPSNPSIVYEGNDGGIFKSTDAGAHWTSLNNSMFSATQFQSLALHPFDRYFMIGGTQDNGTEWQKPDQTWTRADYGDGGFALIDQNAADTTNVRMYHTYYNQAGSLMGCSTVNNTANAHDAAWSFYGCGGLYNGISCSATATLFYAPMALGPGVPNTLYYGNDRLYRSPDNGATMTLASQAPIASNFAITAIGVSPQDDNVRIVGLRNGQVWATTTGSSTLTNVTSASFPANPGSAAYRFVGRAVIDPNNKNTAYVTFSFYAPAGQGIWKTTDLNSGTPTWTAAGSGIPSIPINAFVVDPQNSSILYAGTDVGVYQSTDGGSNWSPFGTGLPAVAVFDLAIQNPNRVLRASTHGRGIYEIAIPGSVQPFLTLGTVTATPTVGNGDAYIDPGESANLNVVLSNAGVASATSISATLSTATPGVAIITPGSAYPDLAVGTSATNTSPFSFSLASNFPCGQRINFTLTVTYAQSSNPRVFAFSVLTGHPGTTATTISYAGVPVAIPDNTAAGIDVPLPVSGFVGGLSSLTLSIDGTSCNATPASSTVGLDHTWVGDLQISLISPAGTNVVLALNNGGAGINFCNTVFDDSASTSIASATSAQNPFTGSWKPIEALAAFVGENPNGTWKLHVADTGPGDTGSVRAFSLHIVPAFCCPVISIGPSTLPGGVVGAAYSQTLTASGGVSPYTWSITGNIPGVNLTPSASPSLTATLAGTPTSAGTFTFTVTATDANGCAGSRQYTVTVAAYDMSFQDDYGRSTVCINSYTGAYVFTKLQPLPQRMFTGVATIQTNTSLLLYMSKVGFNLVYNKSLHTCTSAVISGTQVFSLLDRNTLDDPPVSCGAQPEGTQPR